jgi:putative hydrolase of the HAD superfamily
MARGEQFDVVGFDADDTLWRSEDSFDRPSAVRREGRPSRPEGIDVLAALRATERANLSISGYGVKAFALSMVEAA